MTATHYNKKTGEHRRHTVEMYASAVNWSAHDLDL